MYQNTAMNNYLYNTKKSDIDSFLIKHNQSTTNTKKVLGHIYRRSLDELYNDSNLSKQIKTYISQLSHTKASIYKVHQSKDQTIKFLIELGDQTKVETVLIPFYKKYALCVSSQVGCAMKCHFCHTGTQPLVRNLTSEEIVAQYILVRDYIQSKIPIKNIMFMGQGEPLHNIESVEQAIDIFLQPEGLSIGRGNITLSTCGYLPGLKKFSSLKGINLALSLHSTFDEVREKIMPIQKAFPLDQVMHQIDQIPLRKRQVVEYEYLLLKDINDNSDEIERLISLLKERKHMLNLIQYNPFDGSPFDSPSSEKINWFYQQLKSSGIRTTLRRSQGQDIMAACGQLKTSCS